MALVFLMAISLSMDAFSLALIYGTLGMKSKNKFILSIIVGLYHFVMPILGMIVGEFIFDMDIIATVILCFIGIEMIVSSFKDKSDIKPLKFRDYFLFGFAVSIDSFSLGITLPNMGVSSVFAPIIFAFISGLFTLVGLLLGNRLARLFGNISTVIGGIILCVIGIVYLF